MTRTTDKEQPTKKENWKKTHDDLRMTRTTNKGQHILNNKEQITMKTTT